MPAAPATPAISTKQTWQNAALQGWRSKRVFAFVLLAFAVVIGAYLRFHRLTLADMNGDEGVSWAAAIQPSTGAVIQTQRRSDFGKLAVYDLVLHGWIGIFGDSLFWMRALSATLGTISIVLLFGAVREVCLCLADEPSKETAALAGAFAALIFATNTKMVLASRLVRMYPLMLACAFVQIMFFVRALRHGKLQNYAAIAVFTALMIATNFTSSFLLLVEGLWLAALLLGGRAGGYSDRTKIFVVGGSVVAGLIMLVPAALSGAAATTAKAISEGIPHWTRVQPITWPYTVIRNSVGSHTLFWVFIALGILGAWRQWRSARLVPGFLALWMIGPVLAVVATTYLIHPLEFYRYVFIAFAGLFALAGLGAASIPSTFVRIAFAVLIVHLALHTTRYAVKHPYEPSWRKAVALAVDRTTPGQQIAVFPHYCVHVVRFYMNPARRQDAHGIRKCGSASVLLLAGRGVVRNAKIVSLDKCYPRLIKQLFLIQVRSQ